MHLQTVKPYDTFRSFFVEITTISKPKPVFLHFYGVFRTLNNAASKIRYFYVSTHFSPSCCNYLTYIIMYIDNTLDIYYTEYTPTTSYKLFQADLRHLRQQSRGFLKVVFVWQCLY